MAEGATLLINVANPAIEYATGQWSGGGTLRLAATNASSVVMDDDNNNWVGDIIIDGGTLKVRGNANALGNLRGITTINGGGSAISPGSASWPPTHASPPIRNASPTVRRCSRSSRR